MRALAGGSEWAGSVYTGYWLAPDDYPNILRFTALRSQWRLGGKGGVMVKGGKEEQAQTVQIRAVVDRIEDGAIAVLSLDDEKRSQLDLPLAQLPAGTSDGDHLRLTFELDPNSGQRALKKIALDKGARAKAADRVRRLQEQLEQLGGTQDKKDFQL